MEHGIRISGNSHHGFVSLIRQQVLHDYMLFASVAPRSLRDNFISVHAQNIKEHILQQYSGRLSKKLLRKLCQFWFMEEIRRLTLLQSSFKPFIL